MINETIDGTIFKEIKKLHAKGECPLSICLGSQRQQEKVAERLKSRNVVFNEKWIHEPRYSLIASKKWMNQLKNNLLNM